MLRYFSLFAGFCALAWLVGCGGGAEKGSPADSVKQEHPVLQDTAPAAEPFDLMDYSALDTNSGVFYGEYDEEVNDEITVRVALEVTLQEGLITNITLLDTAWVRPEAAQRMPQRIIEQQKLPVDAVSGASVASWSIMTATAIALEIDLTELDDLAAGDDDTEETGGSTNDD